MSAGESGCMVLAVMASLLFIASFIAWSRNAKSGVTTAGRLLAVSVVLALAAIVCLIARFPE